MATFKPTSMAGKTTGAKKNTFTPTKYAGYNQSALYGWQRQNQSALDLINKYNTRVQNGEWLSVEDRAGYKSAIDSYTSSGTELRKASKFYGETGSIGDERRWYDSLSSLNEGYTGINNFYNQFKNDREYGVWKADADKRTEFEGLKNSNDYDYYVNIGKNSQANNIWNDIKKVADANHYSIGEFISDIKDGDWEALGGRALEQIISQLFPKSSIVNPIEVGSAFLDIRDFAKKWTTDKATMEEYLTPQEMDNYYYLIGKGDYEKANNYAKYYSDIARKAKGEAQVPNINNNIKELATAFESGLASFSTGFDQTLSVLGSILYDKDVNVYTPTTSQYAYGKAREDNTGLWMMATDAAQSIGNQVPNYALAFATGGASGFIPMAISAGGNAYAEMINDGYGEGSAIAKGVATGALEALLGKWLGGLPGLGSSGGVFKGLQQKFLPQMSNTVARFLINNGVNMADEALEEGLQELLDPVVKWAVTLGEAELEKVNWEEVGYSALLGGLTAGVLEGVPSAIGTANTSIKTQQAFGNQAPSIVAETLAVDPTNKIALNAQNKLANNKTVSGGNLNEMLTTTDRARVKEAITNQLTEYGETSDISTLAEALTKQTMGEELSNKESKLIEASKYGNRIANELNPENIKSGQYTSKWAESIGTRRLNADVYSRRPSTKVKTKDGAESTINNVRSVAEGVATVELADGKVAKVGLDKGTTSDLVFNDPKAEGLFRIATDRVGKVEGWTTETANAMIKAYDGSTLDASAFARGWSEAYNIGKSNNSQAQLNNSSWAMLLDNKTRADAYNIGKAMSTPRVITPTTNTYKVSFDSTVDEKSLTNEQKTQVKALDVISKALGVNVVVFDSPMGADGKRVGKNGSYNPNTRTVEIDLHAGVDGKGLMMFTAAHELTHHMREVASDKFNAYADAVFEALGENGRELVERRVSSLRASGRLDGKTDEEAYDLAFEEVVADSAERMLVDTDALAKLSESLKSKDKPLWEKVKDYIVGLVDKIKKIYASLNPDSQEARMLSEMEDKVENIRKLWVEGIVASAEVSDKVAAELGVEIDTASESVSPTLMSERTWAESEYVVNRNAMAKKIALALNISERKAKQYIDDVNSIARMIANDRVRLDYQASSFGSAFVSNVEYGGSFDYTTLCKKRRLYTGTFSEIQKRLHDVALSPDEILTVRNMLIEAHKEATCGLCYVEGSRANMGKFAQKFIELYKRGNPDAWVPNMVDVNTPDGVEQMRINHPEAYEQYEYFWNHYGKLKDSDPALFASQQKPKLYEARKEYKGEILTHFKGETTIEKKNLNGGIRMQSFSDFEIIHLIDTMQVIMDMSTVGLAGQAYTKVPEFALAFGNTGLKINLSLIAKGVDENGKLIFDDREGMPHETAFDIRNKYSKNVGTIIVTFTDGQLMAAMADERIDYIIPFHRSQWKKGQYGAMGLPKGTKDYTFMQNEKLIKQTYHEYQGRMVKDKATNYMPNEYWDFSKSGKENAEAYLKMCAENNKRPKFYKLLDYDGNGTYSLKKDGSTDGYWKLLIDFKMYDNNGKGSPQTPVIPRFNMDKATKMLDEYKGGHEKYPIAYDVVDKFVEQYNKDMGTKYSDRDSYAPTFYSHMGRVIDEIKLEKMGANGVVSYLKGRGVKDEEIKWSGIETFLEGKKSVTKAELQEFVAGSQLRIEELEDDRWSDYALEGGTNYRDIIFKMPESTYSNNAMRTHWGDDAEGVLAHARIQDFEVDGKKMLFVEELQSDWHNEGRKAGYDGDNGELAAARRRYHALKAEGIKLLEDLRKHNVSLLTAEEKKSIADAYYEKDREIQDEMDALVKQFGKDVYINETLAPDAPFRNNYHEYVLKRLLRMAAEGGYDSIGWTTADIQSQRWSDEYAEGYRIEYDQDIPKFLRKYGKKWGATVGKTPMPSLNSKETYYDVNREESFDSFAVWQDTVRATIDQQGGDQRNVLFGMDGNDWIAYDKHTGIEYDRAKVSKTSDSVWSMPIPDSMKESVLYEGQVMYQDRLSPEEAFSNRSLLANALLDTVQSDIEYKKLDDYKAVIGYLEAEETKLADLKRKIYEATFGDGDKSKLKELREEARKTEARIDLHDKKLLQLESTTALKNVLERAKKQAYSKALEKGREAMHRNVEGRYKTIERNKIKKIAHELDTLLNKGNKKRNVKIGAQGVVRAALDLSNMYFATDDELIMAGIETIANDRESDAVERYKKLYERLHATDDDVTNNKEDRAELRHEMNEVKKEFADLIERERKRINSIKAKDIFSKLIDEYKKLSQSPETYIAKTFDAETLQHIEQLQNDMGDKLASEMTLEDLENLYKAFKMIKTMVSNANKLFKEEGDATVEKFGAESLNEIRSQGHKEKFTKLEKAVSALGWNNLKPVYLIERTGSKVLQKLFQKVLDAESVWAKTMADAKAFIDEQVAKYNYKKWDFKTKYEFATPSDMKFKLDLGQMMTIYAYSKRGEQAIEHLRTDGFVFDTVTEKKLGGIVEYEYNDKTAYKITDDVRMKIIGMLTQEQKNYVDAMQKYLSKDMGAKGNEVSIAMYGIELFGEENYLPIHSEGAYLERVREQAKGDVKIKNKGFTKSTTKHARNAIVLSEFDKLCTEHIAEMSSYYAFTLPLEDFYRVYNYEVASDDKADKMGVIPALINAFGEGSTQAIDQLLSDLNGGARTDQRETLPKMMMSLYKKAKVMLSLSVIVQQPSAILRAQAMVDPKYFINKRTGNHKQLWNEMKEYAPVTIIKEMGHFDVGMGKSSADWLLSEDTFMDKVDEFASKPASLADEVTWVAIWNAVKRETASLNPTLNTSSKEFLKKAGERFEDVIRHTQVYDSTLARSGNMRSKSALMQMEMAFMAEPTTSLNMREMALRSKDKKRIARTTAAVYTSSMLNSILVAFIYAMRDDDEDETFEEKYIQALTSSFIDNINPLSALPIAKNVWSLAQGYGAERSDMALADELLAGIKKLATMNYEDAEGKDIAKAVLDLVGDLSALTGLPVANVVRDVYGIINFVKTITKGDPTTLKSIEDALQETLRKETPVVGWFKGESKGEKLYEAILAKDDKYVERFKSTYKDEDAYNSALRKAIRDNDPRLEEAALARLNGDRDTYYRLMMDVIDEGNFDKQIIKDAFDAEYNYQKRLAEENK